MDLSGYRVGGQWYVIRTEVSRGEHVKEFETYTNLMFIMYLRRKPLYYVFNIVLPSVILALLALLVFMLPPEAGEKMSLGITVLLSFTVFQLLVADSMPKTSDFIPIIAIYITSTMMMTAFSLLLSVVILSLHYHWPDEDVSPRCKTVADFFARLLCVKTYWSSTCPADRFRVDAKAKDVFKSMTWNGSVHYEPNHDPLKQSLFLEKILDDLKYLRGTCEELEASSARRRDWVQLARVFDRLLLAIFLVFNLVMIVTIFLIVPHTKDNRSTLRTLVTPEMF